jgi:hypothetical protein
MTTQQIRGALASHCHVSVIALSTDVVRFDAIFAKMRAGERLARRNSRSARGFGGARTSGRDMANAALARPLIPFSSIQNHDALWAHRLRLH